jgi:Uma2 family endonuclease
MAVERLELESRPPLTVEEFETLALEAGWDEDTRIELLDGEVIPMNPVNDPHIGCVNRLTRLFARRYGEDVALLSIQNPLRVGEHDLPQPDVALLKPRGDFYATGKATPADVLVLVEISDTTLRTDLGRKARIFADAGIREYWVIDLNNHVLYVHRAPGAGRYQTRHVLGSEDSISAEFASDIKFSVGDLIG